MYPLYNIIKLLLQQHITCQKMRCVLRRCSEEIVRYLTVEKKALILFILLTSVVSSCNSGLSFELLCLYLSTQDRHAKVFACLFAFSFFFLENKKQRNFGHLKGNCKKVEVFKKHVKKSWSFYRNPKRKQPNTKQK